MESRPLAVITTRLPPQICGIGTYSWLLHQHWPLQHSAARFLVIDGAAESTAKLGYAAISEFDGVPEILSRELDKLGPVNMLLHYAGRAYHRYGCPTWLPAVVAEWKEKSPASRLLVLFHELPGDTFPITSRHFWIDRCNRRVIRKIAAVADLLVTNTAEHVAKLREICGCRDVHWVPVGSNIEPVGHRAAGRADTEFAIFGLPFGRWQTLQLFGNEMRSWQKNGRMTKLHLIGPSDDKSDKRESLVPWADPNGVVRHGLLSSADVSALLSTVRFALSNATSGNWSKSSTFMAYAAHGCAVISKARAESAPLCFTITPAEVPTISDVDLSARTSALQNWYYHNADWNVIAAKIAALLA
jgi:hypothetical protein